MDIRLIRIGPQFKQKLMVADGIWMSVKDIRNILAGSVGSLNSNVGSNRSEQHANERQNSGAFGIDVDKKDVTA